ncbi:hypothetical protein GYA19_03650 [Candidatus Beckwithbacteria bacterium]|nr:hypothetical protein [Candidatus Beckwithbacteria bacterium]
MAKINEINEQKIVVQSVGGFASSLQQIATMRMTSLRRAVLDSQRFVEEATQILRELKKERQSVFLQELRKVDKHFKTSSLRKEAIIVISSYQGLCGSYNTEIEKKLEKIVPQYLRADYFVIGSKGQEIFKKFKRRYPDLQWYPYDVPEEVKIENLHNLINMFVYYDQIHLIYSKYINTTTRDVVFLELLEPALDMATELESEEEAQGEFLFEPDIEELIEKVSEKLRYALFRQQILDSKLSLYTAQMIAMKTASDNADKLLKDLQLEYNKARRKMIDRKIQEVQAGRALWAEE